MIEPKSKPKPAGKSGPADIVGAIRFHESGGEVHFHDDAAGLKVAMPVAEWWKAWQKLRHGDTPEWSWHDVGRKAVLRIAFSVDDDKGPPVLECEARIERVEHGPAFAKLEAFTPER